MSVHTQTASVTDVRVGAIPAKQIIAQEFKAKDEINVPISLSAFRDKRNLMIAWCQFIVPISFRLLP